MFLFVFLFPLFLFFCLSFFLVSFFFVCFVFLFSLLFFLFCFLLSACSNQSSKPSLCDDAGFRLSNRLRQAHNFWCLPKMAWANVYRWYEHVGKKKYIEKEKDFGSQVGIVRRTTSSVYQKWLEPTATEDTNMLEQNK